MRHVCRPGILQYEWCSFAGLHNTIDAVQYLQKLDPLLKKLEVHYKESTTAEAQKKAIAFLFSSDPSGTQQPEADAMKLEYEYQNAGLLSLPDELMLLTFKFFKDKPLCLGQLSMSCKQLYMLICM